MLQSHGNRWKRQRLETKIRSDPERCVAGGCWGGIGILRAARSPHRAGDGARLAPAVVRGCSQGTGRVLQIRLLPTAFFAYCHGLHLLLATAGEEAMLSLPRLLGGDRGSSPSPQLVLSKARVPRTEPSANHSRAASHFLCLSPFLTCEPWSAFQGSMSLLKCTFLKCCTG